MTFLIDAQLPPALARWLRDAGHDSRHVEDVSLREANDSDIWKYVLETGAILVTKDEDFATRAAHASTAPVIVWLRFGNASNRALIVWLEPRWPAILQLLDEGHRLIEVV